MATLSLLFLVGAGLLAWRLLGQTDDSRDVDVYDVTGPQPGDLTPGLKDIADNVRNYGLPHDLKYTFSTNSHGMRGPEPPAGAKTRVLVLGDSFAFGMGVDDGDTFPDQLQRALGPTFAVYNAAVPGYTIADQREQWHDGLAALKPDIVLLCHTASDLKEMARPTSFRRFMRHDDEDPAYFDADVEALVQKAGSRRDATRRFYTFTQDQLASRFGAAAATRLRGLLSTYVDEVVALSRDVGPARLGVIFWVTGYGMAGLTTAPVREGLNAAGVRWFDGDTAIKQQREIPPDRLFLPDDHFSAEGNRLAAKQATAWILGVLQVNEK